MSDNDEVPLVDQLMSALITKMEKMDTDIDALRHVNQVLKGIISNPDLILRKAGFTSSRTPHPTDILPDTFRGDSGQVLKEMEMDAVPSTNEEFHAMSWEDIHSLADTAKSAGVLGNQAEMV